MKPKYIACFNIATFFLFSAAVLFELSLKCHNVMAVKTLRYPAIVLLAAAAIMLTLFPLILVEKDFQTYDLPLILGNSGLVLMVSFIKEIMDDWKKMLRKKARRRYEDITATYFEQLPKITQTRKKPVYFEFD
ncbi:MAG TPA: hypothetical protein VIM29_09500 [Bacillota bacterium]